MATCAPGAHWESDLPPARRSRNPTTHHPTTPRGAAATRASTGINPAAANKREGIDCRNRNRDRNRIRISVETGFRTGTTDSDAGPRMKTVGFLRMLRRPPDWFSISVIVIVILIVIGVGFSKEQDSEGNHGWLCRTTDEDGGGGRLRLGLGLRVRSVRVERRFRPVA